MEKVKENKTKCLRYKTSPTLRALIESANDEGVTRDDFVSLNKSEGLFILVYYK